MGVVFVLVDENGDEVIETEEIRGVEGGRNNEMELGACVAALRHVNGRHTFLDRTVHRKIVIRTDSEFVVKGYESARHFWSINGWKKRGGAPVEHHEDWRSLLREVKRTSLRVEIKKVKGHSKDPYNRIADQLAKASARGFLDKPPRPRSIRRKRGAENKVVGGTQILGQFACIYVGGMNWVSSPHRCFRVSYEMWDSETNEWLPGDLACTSSIVRDGHTYLVKFNDDQGDPRIDEVLYEVDGEPSSDQGLADAWVNADDLLREVRDS